MHSATPPDGVERVLDPRRGDDARAVSDSSAVAIDEPVVAERCRPRMKSPVTNQVSPGSNASWRRRRGIDVRDVGCRARDSRATSMPGSSRRARTSRPRPSRTKSSSAKSSTRRSRPRGWPGSGRPTEPIFLPRGVGEHGVGLGRGVELEHADRPEALDEAAPHVGAHAASRRTGAPGCCSRRAPAARRPGGGTSRRRRTRRSRRSGGPRPRTSSGSNARASASRAPPTSALPTATSVPDGWCSGRQQYTVSRVVSVAAAAAPSAENAQRRLRDPRRARRLVRARRHEHHREVARAARRRAGTSGQRDGVGIDRLHVDARPRGSSARADLAGRASPCSPTPPSTSTLPAVAARARAALSGSTISDVGLAELERARQHVVAGLRRQQHRDRAEPVDRGDHRQVARAATSSSRRRACPDRTPHAIRPRTTASTRRLASAYVNARPRHRKNVRSPISAAWSASVRPSADQRVVLEVAQPVEARELPARVVEVVAEVLAELARAARARPSRSSRPARCASSNVQSSSSSCSSSSSSSGSCVLSGARTDRARRAARTSIALGRPTLAPAHPLDHAGPGHGRARSSRRRGRSARP